MTTLLFINKKLKLIIYLLNFESKASTEHIFINNKMLGSLQTPYKHFQKPKSPHNSRSCFHACMRTIHRRRRRHRHLHLHLPGSHNTNKNWNPTNHRNIHSKILELPPEPCDGRTVRTPWLSPSYP